MIAKESTSPTPAPFTIENYHHSCDSSRTMSERRSEVRQRRKLRRLRRSAYHQLRELVPRIADKKVNEVDIVEEARKHIDYLHEQLAKKFNVALKEDTSPKDCNSAVVPNTTDECDGYAPLGSVNETAENVSAFNAFLQQQAAAAMLQTQRDMEMICTHLDLPDCSPNNLLFDERSTESSSDISRCDRPSNDS